MEEKTKKKGIFTSIKEMSSEKKLVIIVIFLVLIFMLFMPKLYRGWVAFRDNGYRFKKENKSSNQQTMVCTNSMNDPQYQLDIEMTVDFVDEKLKRENHTIVMKARTDKGKEEVKESKKFYEEQAKSYQKFAGFTVKTSLKKDTLTHTIITDYQKIDRKKIEEASENEEDGISVELQLNQDMESVQAYYESLGLVCKK